VLPTKLALVRDAGVLQPSGCNSGQRLIVWLQSPSGPLFCTVLLYVKGQPRTFFQRGTEELTGMEGYGLAQVRAGGFCESIEAPDGGLDLDRSVQVDEIWGRIDPAIEFQGTHWAISIPDGGGVRLGENQFSWNTGLFSTMGPCEYP
jgi:hypothetical protein